MCKKLYNRTLASYAGFTLAELLISLLILGEIATFTIPKILVSQQNTQYKAITKEVIGTVSGAYQKAQLAGIVSASTTIGDLTPYMNYISTSTSLVLDDVNTNGSFACSATYPCLIFHNGSALHYSLASFGGTSTTNANWFHIDPNGSYGGTTNGPDKAVGVFLYYNGRMTDEGNILSGTTNSSSGYSANAGKVPAWFSW